MLVSGPEISDSHKAIQTTTQNSYDGNDNGEADEVDEREGRIDVRSVPSGFVVIDSIFPREGPAGGEGNGSSHLREHTYTYIHTQYIRIDTD